MYNRQPWEIPTELTTEEFAELTGESTHKIKLNAKKAGWAYWTAPEGVKYWDLRTVDRGFPDKIFHGLVKKDNAACELKKAVWFETDKFLESRVSVFGELSQEKRFEYQEAALLCRCLEIIHEGQIAMPWLAVQLAGVELAMITRLNHWDIIDIAIGRIFEVPLFCLDRRYWLELLLEHVRYTRIHGPVQRIEHTDQEMIKRINMISKGKISW